MQDKFIAQRQRLCKTCLSQDIGGRQGLTTTLSNVSEVTGQAEAVNVSTVQLADGSLLFLVGVAPSSEARAYLDTFARVRRSVELAPALRVVRTIRITKPNKRRTEKLWMERNFFIRSCYTNIARIAKPNSLQFCTN
jgi:hypothetical protein